MDASDVDPTAVEQSDEPGFADQSIRSGLSSVSRLLTPTRLNAWGIIGLVGTLCVVVAARLVAAPTVLYADAVVSPANDTYFFS